jgi:hypothetical protein
MKKSTSFVKKTKFSAEVRANINTLSDILDSAFRAEGMSVDYREKFASIRVYSAVAKPGNFAERALELCVERGYEIKQVGEDLVIRVPHC